MSTGDELFTCSEVLDLWGLPGTSVQKIAILKII